MITRMFGALEPAARATPRVNNSRPAPSAIALPAAAPRLRSARRPINRGPSAIDAVLLAEPVRVQQDHALRVANVGGSRASSPGACAGETGRLEPVGATSPAARSDGPQRCLRGAQVNPRPGVQRPHVVQAE